jgi:hypothetical protein
MEKETSLWDTRTGPVWGSTDIRWRTGSSSSCLPQLQLPLSPGQLPRGATSLPTSPTAHLYQVKLRLFYGPFAVALRVLYKMKVLLTGRVYSSLSVHVSFPKTTLAHTSYLHLTVQNFAFSVFQKNVQHVFCSRISPLQIKLCAVCNPLTSLYCRVISGTY